MLFLKFLFEFFIIYFLIRFFDAIWEIYLSHNDEEVPQIPIRDARTYYPNTQEQAGTILSLSLPEPRFKEECLAFANELPNHTIDSGFKDTNFNADTDSFEDWLERVNDSTSETLLITTDKGRVVGIMGLDYLNDGSSPTDEAEIVCYQIRPSDAGKAYDGIGLLLYAQFIINCCNNE